MWRRSSPRRGSERPGGQPPLSGRFPGPVQTAGRIALEVERDEFVARRPQRIDHSLAFRHQTRDLGRLDLDSCDLTVMANAHLLEPEALDSALAPFDLPHPPHPYPRAVPNAPRQ